MPTSLVLAIFGTTVPDALPGLIAIRDHCRAVFPDTETHFACTSDTIRAIWQQRAADPNYRRRYPDVPEEIFSLRGVLATIGHLQDMGQRRIVIQPVSIAPAEEYHDLLSCVRGLASMRAAQPQRAPFEALALGRPLFGGGHQTGRPYADDILTVVQALAGDAELARREKAVLLYAGHGSSLFPVGGLYLEFAARMRQLYPDVVTEIACLEGFPTLTDVMAKLSASGAGGRIIIRPLLVAAGMHTRQHLAGDDPASWRSRLVQAGWQVLPVLTGLGEMAAIAEIFAQHAADTAVDAGFSLE
jgi:sirohydrochlorin cobaltochelatase